MAYTINLTNGTVLTTIADGTVTPSTVCSLTLIGKNYSGYGTFLNSDFVHLLENFSNDTAPPAPLQGQLWWDSAGNLKVYTGSIFKTLSTITSSSSAPSGAVTGNGWWDTVNQQYNVYNGSNWTLIGPAYSSGTGLSGTVVGTILDTSASPHVAVNVYVSNSLVGVISKDTNYIPQVAINGFSSIKPGFNLASSGTIPGIGFWGTASNASALNGVSASSFLRSDAPATINNTLTVNYDSGLTVGTSNNFIASVSGTTVQLTNNVNNGDLAIRANVGGTPTTAISVAGATGATTVIGSLTAANYLLATKGDPATSTTTGALRVTGGIGVTGNIVSGGNISAVGTINVNGNISTSGNILATANASAANFSTIGTITAVGNVTAGNLITTGSISAATLTTGSISAATLTFGSTNVSGNITAGNITATANIASGNLSITSNLTAGGNISAAYYIQTSSNNENPSVSQFMVTNGTDNVVRKASVTTVKAALGSLVPSMATFTSSGTWTVPAGVTSCRVTVVGGGGGGGSVYAYVTGGASGGGGGGTAIKTITGLTPGTGISVTVGTGGAAATSGGSSSFGAYCSATGGGAGVHINGYTSNFDGGAGGVGSSGDINIKGGGGGSGTYSAQTPSGIGGSSTHGGGGYGRQSYIADSNGATGGNYGGGGSGAYGVSGAASSGTGGSGANGIVIVEY